MKKSVKFLILLTLVAIVVAGTLWYLPGPGINPANAALAEFQIEKMTCGSCIGNIEEALSRIDGIGDVDVNLTRKRGRVTYDSSTMDSRVIADAITAAGYPATLRLELTPDEYRDLQQEQVQLSRNYVAKIGDRLLSRTDFEQLVQQRSGGVVPSEQTDRLWQSVWQDVLQRELLLAAAESNRVTVQPGEVDLKIEELQQAHQGLEELVSKQFGAMDAFRERIREDMIINRTIEEHVYAGIADPRERQAKLQSWYANLQNDTVVEIYDPKLKAAGPSGSGCGGGCCG
ncbi:MAG: cation transporter [Desulfuromonadales bacterium]|jgi:copper chaperone CopZ